MINREARSYNFFTFGDKDEYGQPILSQEAQGVIKMSVYPITQALADNVNYKTATYIGLTSTNVSSDYVIEYEGVKLKVLYVNPKGRLKQVYLEEM